MEKTKLLERYHSRIIALERRSRLTAETYGHEIRMLLDWLEKQGLSAEKADYSDVCRYLEKRRVSDGIDSRSEAKAVSALRSFFRFLSDEKIITDNCIDSLESPRIGTRLPNVLDEGDGESLLEDINTETSTGLRDRALYGFIYASGLRISEAAAANVQDLMLNERIAKVTGKGSKERIVVYTDETAEWLKRYLEEARPALLKQKKSNAVFISKNGKRLSRKSIWQNYAALAKKNGISSKVHALRHTFATNLLAGGADLRSVQELLGHSDLATTQIYTHVNSKMLRDSHRKFLPRLKGLVNEN